MTSVFDRHGIRFQYPEGWEVVEQQADEQMASVTVQSSKSGFWSVSAHPASLTPVRLLQQALETMRQEYPGLEAEAVEQQVEDHRAPGYDMQFFCMDLLVTARVFAWQQSGRTLMVMWQAEDREFDELERVFAAISTSLVRELG